MYLNRIKTLAKAYKITLRILAEKVGLSEQGLHKCIRANRISAEILYKIAQVFDVDIDCFFNINYYCTPPLTKEYLIKNGFIRSDMFSDEITEAFYTPNEPYLLITPAKTTTVVAPARNYVNFWLRTVEELQEVMRLLSINIELKL